MPLTTDWGWQADPPDLVAKRRNKVAVTGAGPIPQQGRLDIIGTLQLSVVVRETLLDNSATQARVSVVVRETLQDRAQPQARVSGVVRETLQDNAAPKARVAVVVRESLLSTTIPLLVGFNFGGENFTPLQLKTRKRGAILSTGVSDVLAPPRRRRPTLYVN